MIKLIKTQIEREKAFYLYTSALERGDFETLETILAQAEQDTLLEKMILELNEQFREEEETEQFNKDATLVSNLLVAHLSTVRSEQLPETKLDPLTIQDVLFRMKTEPQLLRQFGKELEVLNARLRNNKVVLPVNLNKPAISRLFRELEVNPTVIFQKAFRETAIFLQMGREQHQAQLAAARNRPRYNRPEGD